jgi:hypothetical protein
MIEDVMEAPVAVHHEGGVAETFACLKKMEASEATNCITRGWWTAD